MKVDTNGNIILEFSSDINMREIYCKIMNDEVFENRRCPQLIPEQDLPDGLDYVELCLNGEITGVITRKGLTADTILKILEGNWKGNNKIIDISKESSTLQCLGVDSNVSLIYSIAYMISIDLGIRCPPIIIRKKETILGGDSITYRGTCFNDNNLKTTSIDIIEKEGQEIVSLSACLAHEMRHCWQHETDPIMYFEDYKYYLDFPQKKMEKYYLQPAEIDAYAYESQYLNAITGKNIDSLTSYYKANRAIKERMAQIGESHIPCLFS